MDYLPPFMQEFKEIAAIMDAEQPEFELAWREAENALADQFILTATINGIKRYESIYDIVPKGTDTLEERRFKILTKKNDKPPYTLNSLRSTLNALCGENGYAIYMNYNEYELVVKLAISNTNNFTAVAELLEKVLPANIVRKVSMFNTHGMLSKLTHKQLAQYTQWQLRNEVIQ